MIRFIMRKKEKCQMSGATTEIMYTIDISAEELEKALTAGGRGEDCYEIHELVGVEIVD